MELQQRLLEVQWPEEILADEHACPVKTPSGQLLFNGLRVRIAMHSGIPSSIKVAADLLAPACNPRGPEHCIGLAS